MLHRSNVMSLPYHKAGCHSPGGKREITVIDIQGKIHDKIYFIIKYKLYNFCTYNLPNVNLLFLSTRPTPCKEGKLILENFNPYSSNNILSYESWVL